MLQDHQNFNRVINCLSKDHFIKLKDVILIDYVFAYYLKYKGFKYAWTPSL